MHHVPSKRYAKKQAKARQRRRRTAQERLARDRRQAQHAAKVVEQALHDLGLPENLVAEIEGRLRSQQKLLGKIVGMMCPPLFGCRTNSELCRVRGWDKNLPSRLLGALPKRSWLKRLRRLGLEVLVPLWRYAASKSEATRSRWQWTWVGDDSVFKKYGEQLGLVGTWWSGQEHRVLSGIDGVLLVVVSLAMANWSCPSTLPSVGPIPQALGRRAATNCAGCRACSMDASPHFTDAAWHYRLLWSSRIAGLVIQSSCTMWPPPTRVRSSWKGRVAMSSNCLMGGRSRATTCSSTASGLGGHSEQVPGVRYARLRATSPTYGVVTITIVKEPGVDQYYVMCLETAISSPRLIRAWKRRSWIEHCFRTLKHLLATGACQVQSEDAYYGHLVLRLMGCLVLFYTSRVVCKGRLTMEEIIFSLKHYWRFVDCEALELKALSQGVDEKAA